MVNLPDVTDFTELAQGLLGPGVLAVALMGSMAHGTAGTYSDVDLVRLVSSGAQAPLADGSYLIFGRLVTVSSVPPDEVEAWFTRPERAVDVVAGLRSARVLIDPQGVFATVIRRARAFTWDAAMQVRANDWCSRQMVGWIEEVHKGLQGLLVNDVGRLLNARFGLSWGLSKVGRVWQGVLINGDNDFYTADLAAFEGMVNAAAWRRAVFAIEGTHGHAPTLRQQVCAGLKLYAALAESMQADLLDEDAPLIAVTSARICEALGLSSKH